VLNINEDSKIMLTILTDKYTKLTV